MRIAALGLLLTALVASTAQAGFVSGFGYQTNPLPAPFNGNIGFAVWEGTGGTVNGDANAPVVQSGQFAYLYQITNNVASAADQVSLISATALNATTTGSYTGAAPFAPGTIAPTFSLIAAGNALFSTLSPPVGGVTQVLYFLSTAGPGMGVVNLTSVGAAARSVAAAVPVPVPPALALLLAGAPFAEFIRRRSRRS